MARAVHLGQIPPLRVGFSPFVNSVLLKSFREDYCAMFFSCEVELASGEPARILQRIERRILDCAVSPMPVGNNRFQVQQIARLPLVICMRSDDTLAAETRLDIRQVAPLIKILPDPQAHPAAHFQQSCEQRRR